MRTPALLLVSILLVSGCAATGNVAGNAPVVTPLTGQFMGSPLSGPLDLPTPEDPSLYRGVRVTFEPLPEIPSDLLSPAAGLARTVLLLTDEFSLEPTISVAHGARFGQGDAVAGLPEGVLFADLDGLVAPGMTTVFAVVLPDEIPDSVVDLVDARALRVLLHEDPKSRKTQFYFRLTVRRGDEFAREAVGFDLGSDGRSALIVPSPFPSGGEAILVRVSLGPPPDAGTEATNEFRSRVAACAQGAQEEAEGARRRASALLASDLVDIAIRKASTSDSGKISRRALLFFAGTSGAVIAEDLVLAASEEMFDEFRTRLGDGLASLGRTYEGRDLAWLFDRTACGILVDAQEQAGLDGEFLSILAIGTGGVSHHPGLLREILRDCGDLAEFERRIVAENLVYLASGAPSARVRAYGWLRSRGHSLGDYAPLADPEERRKALLLVLEDREGTK